ncbi:phage major capsid protein [Sphingomonas morindae]|uniref:Phage major capsid protein n=1 Tax=Sphingomonas morindae TaxID=1541170 RepID=A0ABY4X3J5_9SPHN|nr:phage major capsid protein [Sphingomonas morindae]USI71468.1 phage major capsid protein [Sphingomonas morindae]
MDYEVKADALAASFAPLEAVDGLRADMAALKARLDQAAVAAARPALDGAKAAPEARAFIERYCRGGEVAGLEIKAVAGTSGAAGGYAVPRQIDAQIGDTLRAISPLRAIAQVVQIGSAGYRKLIATGGVSSGWAAEDGVRAETATPSFVELAPPTGDLFANPAASQAMLDDAAFDLEAWLAAEIGQEFARAEGAAFINGDGANKPRGLMQAPRASQDDAGRPFGTLQYRATGVDGKWPAAQPENALIDLVQCLRQPYRQGATWLMNAATLASIRKFKTNDGAFLWQPGLAAGQPGTLLGYPVAEAEDMPDIGSGTTPIAFGNFRLGYLIVDRGETAILRDPYTRKPFVYFYASRRVGGCVANSEAIKLLRFAAN